MAARAELSEIEAEEVARSFQAKIIQAIKFKSTSEVASYFSEDGILILGNSQIIRTRANIETFFEAPYLDEEIKISHFNIVSLSIDPGIIIVDTDTFIATGTTEYEMTFSKTKDIIFPGRWLAVLHRENKEWNIASYQTTINIFDNPLLEKTKYVYYFISLIAFLLGIILTIAWKRFKKSQAM